MDSDSHYEPLLSEAPGYLPEKYLVRDTNGRPLPDNRFHKLVVRGGLVLQSFIIIILTILLLKKPAPIECINNPVFPQVLYSPAQEAIEYQNKVFTMGFGRRHWTIYQQPPSPEVDRAWDDLYDWFGLSKIPKWQARLLPNKTLAIPGDEENYAVGLSVFHQLHCLNLMRQGLNPDYYRDPVTGSIGNVSAENWPDHIGHCIDNIRQALMCASDISLVVWQWSPPDDQAVIKMDTIHSCRNFDKIADWAKGHRRRGHFNMSIHVEDDIEIPIIY